MSIKKIAVIGAGIGGLATAIRLAARGHEVHVYDKNPYVGGKLAEHRAQGFRFDMGPSLFTLPELVDELFALAGHPPQSRFRYSKLERITRYFFPSGKKLDAWQQPSRFVDELANRLGESPSNTWRFFRKSQTIYELTSPVFIFGTFHQWRILWSPKFLKAMLQWWKLSPLTTMQRVIDRHFHSAEARQLFGRYATYNGSSPYLAPGTLNVIPHLEHQLGAYFPEQGMYQIAQSLELLATELGVHWHLSTEVSRVWLQGKQCKGLVVGTTEQPYDLVVSDVDVFHLYRRMLPAELFPHRLFSFDRSTSALIFYWGIDREFAQLDLHNVFFSADYPQEFDCLFRSRTVYADPTVYVFVSSKAVPTDAPQGKENWFVMINAPATDQIDWSVATPNIRRQVLAKLERQLGQPIEPHIEYEQVLTPTDIEHRTLSHLGSLYGISSNNRMAAFARHANFSSKIEGLYFVGGSVHPGGGIPLCLASARIVDQMIEKKLKKA